MPGALTIQEELEEVNSREYPGSGSLIREKMSSPEVLLDRRRGSNTSTTMPSYMENNKWSSVSLGTLGTDRDNMTTPQPRPMESPKSKRVTLPEEEYPARREASDATLGVNSLAQRRVSSSAQEEYLQRDQRSKYASESAGKASTTSSGYGARSGSEGGGGEFGERNSSSFARKYQKKPVAVPELLVIVRPPPSKQANPLNLQIQLVIPQVPSSAASNSRSSLDASRDEASLSASPSSGSNGGLNRGDSLGPSTEIRRSASMSSSYSVRSEASSGGQSNMSSASSSSGKRVTPLYNLNFHNITATTVTDAGTEDKVAKFGKKGVEIDGFGQLEPHELVIGVNDLSTLQARRKSLNTRATLPAPTALSSNSGSDPTFPDAFSDVSHAKSTEITFPPSRTSDIGASRPLEEPPTSFDAMSPEAKNPGEGGLGGKLLNKFKRFSISANATAQAKLGSMAAPSVRAGTIDTTTSAGAPTSLLAKMTTKVREGGIGGGDGVAEESDVKSARGSIGGYTLGHALGLDIPQLIAGGGLRSDGRRTEGYYWTVRKWNRRLPEEDEDDEETLRLRDAGSNPILNSVWKRFNIANRMGGQEIHPPCKDVPVRFEWTRNTGVIARRKSSVVSANVRSTTDQAQKSKSKRLSVSRTTRPSIDQKTSPSENGEGGEVERGSLKLPKAGRNGGRPSSMYSNVSPRQSLDVTSQSGSHAGSGDNGGEDSDPEDSEITWSCHLVLGPATRIPIGSLTPTPHHPKLIGQLTVPFPLPDLSQSGLGADGAGLTREELKDIISVTCLFVIIREGFGGLMKKKGVVAVK
ncbi:hypothetical protein CBS101457_002392 [Exobasidium rhododendri]|nr:hypothetical protein CBS101457_002392 [Exobasidium rhododendri]